jgi:hypothetical protein
VYLPTVADWLAVCLHELTSFPKGKHDDQADSTSQALDWAKQWPSRLPLEEFHERQQLRWKLNLPDDYKKLSQHTSSPATGSVGTANIGSMTTDVTRYRKQRSEEIS